MSDRGVLPLPVVDAVNLNRAHHAVLRPDELLTDTEDKARRLAAYGGAATTADMDALIARTWALADAPRIGRWLPP